MTKESHRNIGNVDVLIQFPVSLDKKGKPLGTPLVVTIPPGAIFTHVTNTIGGQQLTALCDLFPSLVDIPPFREDGDT